ncbi:DUF2064 domain-containing protein [Saccharopolyspora sp. MS10]|uniref:TIGR04282 family arsenosugar biosynthesis glycosyltransferase n=1 Tax=Saccharopolyspora sp. MS10 TaxID=3385973 RepID=UPI0039A2F354
MSRGVLLVVAKAPVPRRAKTRLTPPASAEQAASIAAAGLLDTLDAAAGTGLPTVVAWTGETAAAARVEEVRAALARVQVVEQRGDGFAERLVAAHADTGALHPGEPILQIGMDTPQLTPRILARSLDRLGGAAPPDAVLGAAEDGGWWALGVLRARHAEALLEVPMSTAETGARTVEALRSRGLRVEPLPTLSDVDTMADAASVAATVPASRFAAAVAAVPVERGR